MPWSRCIPATSLRPIVDQHPLNRTSPTTPESSGVVLDMPTAVTHRTSTKGGREEILDIARGCAMLFVCLSHFSSVYLLVHKETFAANVLSAVGMLASPTFVCL